MLIIGALAFLMHQAPNPTAQALLDSALARMGGLPALAAIETMRLEVMTEWQRTDFDKRRPPVILSYELSTELRDYARPAWRYTRQFWSPNGASGVVDLVADSVAVMELNGKWRPQNIAYVDERDEVFAFTPERVLRLAREAGDAETLPDTVIDGARFARVTASVGRFRPTLHFRRSDGLLAFAHLRQGQPNDFGLAPWGAMDLQLWYSRWQRVANSALTLPMQLDVLRAGRPYKRMTTISIAVNPTIPADSFAITDSLRTAFLATSRRPMFDLPMDSARIVENAFALFGAPGTPSGAVKLGGNWLFVEAGTAPLTIQRSADYLRRVQPDAAIAGALVTAPTGAGGVAWLARQHLPMWVTSAAQPFTEAALRGWSQSGTNLRRIDGDRWLRVGSDSLRIEAIELPDYPGTAVVYVPTLRWAYAFAAGPVQMRYVVDRIRQRGWRVDRVGSLRNFVGAAIAPTSALAR